MSYARQAFLYRYYNNLRQVDFPLGLDDYLAALSLIEQGFGLADEAALYRLCRLLWLKSIGQEASFKQVFTKTLVDIQREPPLAALAPTVSALPPSPHPFNPEPKPRPPESKAKEPPSTDPLMGKAEIPSPPVGVAKINLTQPTPESMPPFSFQPTRLPFTLHAMKQTWHYLRRYQRSGRATELDIEATIQSISQVGYLLQPVLKPRRMNQARLLLLLDQGGSMTPFHWFSHLLIESAKHGGRLRDTQVYYFRNVPWPYLYTDSARLHGLELKHMVLDPTTLVMIFSDAGAARRSYERKRIEQTHDFLSHLQPQVQRLVWLNPMPKTRWRENSAAEIRRFVPMFELSPTDLDRAIRTLNGQPFE